MGFGCHHDRARVASRAHDLDVRLEQEHVRTDPHAVVGGGVLARESTRQDPSLVRRIVTFGTPVTGGPEYTATRTAYTPEQRRRIQDVIDARNRVPIGVPITAIWSKNDGIVAPAACIDHVQAGVEHVEVTSSHLGMGLDPDVWTIVAKRLAATTRPRS